MATEIWVNFGSGNGLLPDGTKPLPDPMLTDHQWSPSDFHISLITLTSWIIVYIRVFILRKFSALYGLIWVYTLIRNSPFHPIWILFESIRFLYGPIEKWTKKFPPKMSFAKSTRGKPYLMKMRATPAVRRSPMPVGGLTSPLFYTMRSM